MKRSALLLGATGLVGTACLKQLLVSEIYGKITVISRRAISVTNNDVENVVMPLSDMDSAVQHFAVDDVFCCLGTTIRQAGTKENFKQVDVDFCLDAARLSKEQGAKHFLIISAIGATQKSPLFYSKMKGLVESSLIAFNFDKLSIFQPSFLIGRRERVRPAEVFAGVAFGAVGVLMKGPLAKYRPISANRLGRMMVAQGELVAKENSRLAVERLAYPSIMALQKAQ